MRQYPAAQYNQVDEVDVMNLRYCLNDITPRRRSRTDHFALIRDHAEYNRRQSK